MAALSLIIATTLLVWSGWRFVSDDLAWWRERVARADAGVGERVDWPGPGSEGAPCVAAVTVSVGLLEPAPDEPCQVDVRAAAVQAIRLVRLLFGPVVELLPGPSTTIHASPAALRRLLLCVLLATVVWQRRSGVNSPVLLSVSTWWLDVACYVSAADKRRVTRSLGALQGAAEPLGWELQQTASDGWVSVSAKWPAPARVRKTWWS